MRLHSVFRLACASGTLLLAIGAADAGGFAVREQSAYYQGMSFAGAASGDDLSSMFWNPAATAAFGGINTSSSYTVVLNDTDLTATGGALALLGRESGQYGPEATLVPASYANYQVNDRLFLGIALNSPFGFATKPSNIPWAGSPLGKTSKVFSFDINPTIAYKLTPTITVGVGAQIEYFNVKINSGGVPGAFGPPLNLIRGRELAGHDWSAGATAGILWDPLPSTTIGLGYRSPVGIDTEASCHGNSLTTFAASGSILPCNTSHAPVKFTLPETITLSASHDLSSKFTVMGTIEYTNHSRIGTIFVNDQAGHHIDELPLNFKDGWLYALGGEYRYSPLLTLRTGFAYEKAPVTDANRTVFLPDTDRVWASFGASYVWSRKLTFDFGYSHLFYEDDAKLKDVSFGPTPLFSGYGNTSIDIVSIGAKYKISEAPSYIEPLK